MMNLKTAHCTQKLSPLVPLMVCCAVLCIGTASLGQEFRPGGVDDQTAALAQQVRGCLCIATHPGEVRLGGAGILWLTGAEDVWSPAPIERIKDWVARGRVCWVDVALASRFGLTSSVGGGRRTALVAEGAENHPLTAGVSQIEAYNAFRYMRGGPAGMQPILVSANRADHTVVGAWELGDGLIVFRPRREPNVVRWTSRAERDWIEADVADGLRFLTNLHALSLEVLGRAAYRVPRAEAPARARGSFEDRRSARAGSVPSIPALQSALVLPVGLKPQPQPKGILEAFGGIGKD